MSDLFQYSTLKVFLNKKYKSLFVHLNRPDQGQTLTTEMVFELDTLFSWAYQFPEINSIVVGSTSEFFSQGIDEDELMQMDTDKLVRFSEKLQRLMAKMFHLPQTIIFDLKKGARNFGLDLSLAADIRFCDPNATIAFDYLNLGLYPNTGSLGILEDLICKSTIRKWLLSGHEITCEELYQHGFISQINHYENKSLYIVKTLENINKMGQVQRIQLKQSLMENMKDTLNKSFEHSKTIGFPALLPQDWKEYLSAGQEKRPVTFTDTKQMSAIVSRYNKN